MALRVWTNGTDTVIAEDLADVARVLAAHYGDLNRDNDERVCGQRTDPDNPRWEAYGGLACMRIAGHHGEHIATVCDAARADGTHHEFNESDAWRALPDDEIKSIHWTDHPSGVEPKITKTCAEWIASEGRGFLCSTEF